MWVLETCIQILHTNSRCLPSQGSRSLLYEVTHHLLALSAWFKVYNDLVVFLSHSQPSVRIPDLESAAGVLSPLPHASICCFVLHHWASKMASQWLPVISTFLSLQSRPRARGWDLCCLATYLGISKEAKSQLPANGFPITCHYFPSKVISLCDFFGYLFRWVRFFKGVLLLQPWVWNFRWFFSRTLCSSWSFSQRGSSIL